MLRLDRDALICDLAETYNIYDLRAVPVSTLARLSCGLREDSRIKLKMKGAKAPMETILLMAILDDVRWLRWSKTKDAQKNKNMPESVLQSFLGKKERPKITAFRTAEEFERRRAEIIHEQEVE